MSVTQLLICVAAFNLLGVSYAEAQALFEKQFPQFSLTLQSIDSAGYANFAVVGTKKTKVEFQIWDIAAPEEASRLTAETFGDKLLLVSPGKFPFFWVVNPETGQILDHIGAGSTEISADHRFVGYTNLISYGNPDDSTTYWVYDMAASAAENAGRGRVYPVDDSPTSSAPQPRPLSQLFWLDARTFAFGHFQNAVASIVRVKLGERPGDVRVETRELDLTSVLGSTRIVHGQAPPEYFRISWIDQLKVGGRDILRLSLPGDDIRYERWSVDVLF